MGFENMELIIRSPTRTEKQGCLYSAVLRVAGGSCAQIQSVKAIIMITTQRSSPETAPLMKMSSAVT